MKQTITIDGLPVSYEVTGSGAPVVLLHGWGCEAKTMAVIQNALTPHYQVFAIDFPGFGSTPAPPVAWSTVDYTTLTRRWLAALNIENPILIGHSFGGRIIIRLVSGGFAAQKIVLTGGAGIKAARPFSYYIKVYSFKAARMCLEFPLWRAFTQDIVADMRARMGSSDYQKASPVMRETLVKVVNEDLRDLLPQIKTPTLLLYGENDTATPVRDAKIIEKGIVGSGLVVIKNAGHYAFLDKTNEFLLILRSFME